MFVGSADLRSLRASPPETARHALLNENLPRPLGILSCAQRKIPPRCRPHIFPLINARQHQMTWLTRHHWQRLPGSVTGLAGRSTCGSNSLGSGTSLGLLQVRWPIVQCTVQSITYCSMGVGRFSWFGHEFSRVFAQRVNRSNWPKHRYCPCCGYRSIIY